jgi:hypothetical protein
MELRRSMMRALFVVAAALATVHPVHAQEPPSTPSARVLFEEANALMDEGRFPEAAERLERALALEARPAIANNLAIARRATGDAIGATAVLVDLLEGRFGHLSEDRRSVVAELRAAIEREVATLRIAVETRAEVRLDGIVLGWIAGDTSQRVNAGAHVLSATAEDGRVAERRVEVSPGEIADVRLRLPPPSEPADPIALDEPGAPRERDSASALPWIFGIGGAVVAVGVAVLVVVLATRSSDIDSPFPSVSTR